MAITHFCVWAVYLIWKPSRVLFTAPCLVAAKKPVFCLGAVCLSVFCHFLNITTLVINDIMVIVTGNIFSDFCFQIVIVFWTPFLGFGNWNYTKIVQMYPPHSWLTDWWTDRQTHPVLLTWSSRVIVIIYHSHWWVGWCTFKC